MSRSVRHRTDPVTVIEHGLLDYTAAWETQRAHAGARADGTAGDVLMLLEHPSTYTAGRRTADSDRPVDGTPVIDVDRGGKITWHGPGQLVGYPIIGLADPIDVVDYVRRLEQALIEVCDDLGLPTGRVDGRSGVWLAAAGGRPERKIAAIGVRVARGVTLHGFALNCDNDMAGFDGIVPCGIADAGVTTLSRELGRDVTTTEMAPAVRAAVIE
ncbi:MAG: lipoyl(octanoyl) transferase LipB, partial [Mycobacteriaceae bacterium]